jgi:hypothetical protein
MYEKLFPAFRYIFLVTGFASLRPQPKKDAAAIWARVVVALFKQSFLQQSLSFCTK